MGSRCSIAVTEARTKPSKSFSISWSRRLFWTATAAWPAKLVTSSKHFWSKGTTPSPSIDSRVSSADGSRFRLMTWMTPITSSRWSFIGIAIIERVR